MLARFDVVAFTRDRHPRNHCSFVENGGRWAPHGVEGTEGFQFHSGISVPATAVIVDKGTHADEDNEDGFHQTPLGEVLRERGVTRVCLCGIDVEHAVRETVLGSLREGFETWLVIDALSQGEDRRGGVDRTLVELQRAGAVLATAGQIATLMMHQPHPTALIVIDAQKDFFPGGSRPATATDDIADVLNQLVHLEFKRRASPIF